jgi:hypothetical protein
MRLLNFTFKREAYWMLAFTGVPLAVGVLGFLIISIFKLV